MSHVSGSNGNTYNSQQAYRRSEEVRAAKSG